MYSLVSNCKGGLNCVFGKFHHPFCCITAHGIAGAKLVSNWERNMSYTKSLQILHKRISILTRLKVSFLTCK